MHAKTAYSNPIITTLFAGLLCALFLGFSAQFYQGFYLPKLLLCYVLAATCLLFLLTRKDLRLPDRRILLFLVLYLGLTAVSGLLSPAPRSAMVYLSYLLAGSLFYLAFLNLSPPQKNGLLKLVFALAVLQVPLAMAQYWQLPGLWHPLFQGSRITGTIGNPEFLATLFGCAIFIGCHLYTHSEAPVWRRLLLMCLLLLLAGLLITKNKGALLFLAFYVLWRVRPNPWLLLGLAGCTALAAWLWFPDSVRGRLFLWLVSASVFAQYLWFGTGPRQFGSHYLEGVHDLFAQHPELAEAFGSYSAMVLDAHNLFLHQAAELGLGGLVLAVLFALHIMQRLRTHRGYLGAALLFLFFKSLYTVVIATPTGMILLALFLGLLTPARVYTLPPRQWLWAKSLALGLLVLFPLAAYVAFSDYYYQRGLQRLALGQNQQALAPLQRALAINPENGDAYLALAHVHFLQGDDDAMHSAIERAIARGKTMDSMKISAHMLFFRGWYQQAQPLYEYLHIAYPQHLTSMAKLAMIYRVQGEDEMAREMAAKLLATESRRKNPSDSRNRAIALRIYEETQNTAARQ